MNYQTYTSQDFILDDFFKNWVLNPDPQAEVFWHNFQKEHPEKAAAIEEARAFLLRMKFKEYLPSQQDFEADWTKLSTQIDTFEEARKLGTPGKRLPLSAGKESASGKKNIWLYWKSIAASLVLLMVAFAVYYLNLSRSATTITTPYGQIRTIVLPDQSVVTLNANSTLKYTTDLQAGASREVWLEGEAFFEIKKKNAGQKFLVHTSDLVVEVLGTEFNVNGRRKQTQVVLNEGSVKLNINKSAADTAVIMQVGELIEFSGDNENLRKQRVDPVKYSAWKNKEWILDNLSLQEVATKIEETYGVKVEIKNTGIANETVTGAVPTSNLDVLLKALAIAFKIRITHTNNVITIQP